MVCTIKHWAHQCFHTGIQAHKGLVAFFYTSDLCYEDTRISNQVFTRFHTKNRALFSTINGVKLAGNIIEHTINVQCGIILFIGDAVSAADGDVFELDPAFGFHHGGDLQDGTDQLGEIVFIQYTGTGKAMEAKGFNAMG